MTAEHTEPPVAYTRARVAEIGNAWMTYAKSQLELAKDKAPSRLKTLLKIERKPATTEEGQASPSAGENGPSA